ncbi:MAG: Jag N-terminal domain-containing protein [Clostridia bacterium]|nr:Jag N-terminal domain-containing protein [Clostridia bacterium]
MAETYIITAKTVAEAVALAKREYEDADHEISYEIVKMEKKGLFGLLGARDAQIKVTVSKVVSVQSELGSLVADIKNLKTVTDRGSSGSSASSAQAQTPAPAQAQAQEKPQQGQQQRQQKQGQNQQKQQNQNQKQNQQKQQQQNQPKAEKQQQNQPKQQNQNQQKQQGQQQNQPKADRQQQNNQQKQQNQPKQNQQKQQQNNNQQKQQQQPKAEKAAEKPVEKPVDAAVTAEPAEKAAETPYRSALGNQAAPRKRNRQKKAAPVEEDLSAAVTVSAPVGLADFVSEGNGNSFGSGANTSSGGRMNNDIRKKNRGQKPAAEAEKPAEETPALSTTVVPASEVPSRSRRSRGRGRGPVQRTDSDAMASRYDMAESDEDYEKLNALVREAESVFEAKRAEAEPVRPAQEERRREAITEAEMNYALDFVNTLLGNMHLDAHAVPAECPEGEEFDVTEEATVYPKIDIVGDETGILIGHHGETLDSIQYLANLCALRRTKSRDGDYVKIVVDIENYRQKREDTLRTLARRMAARAVKYRRNVFLEPMNAYERRIIHSELQSYDGVSTHSVGTDRDRKIIVTYEGPDKQSDRRKGEEKPAAEQQSQQSGQGKKRSRGRRGGDRSASGNNAQTESAAAVTASAETAEPKESRERRRPRKQQKMSIEELTDWLPDAGEATGEIDDTLNVMSGLRSRVSDDADDADDAIEVNEVVEETAEAAAKAEEAVREAEAKFEAKAAALLETLGALADDKDDE